MAENETRYGLVQFDPHKVVSVNGRTLLGSCNQCGVCCENIGCADLVAESWEGRQVKVCSHYHTRMANCVFWPNDVEAALPASCGYSWSE